MGGALGASGAAFSPDAPRAFALLAVFASQRPQLRGQAQHQRAVEILGIVFARARRRASARQKLTPHNLMNEWGSVADQQIAKPRARASSSAASRNGSTRGSWSE